MGRSPGFGSNPINLRHIKTRFRYGFVTVSLNLLIKLTHRLIIQKARRHLNKLRLRLIVSVWFQVLFHSPLGVLFTFPSRYYFSIGRKMYLALRDGPRGFNQNFSCSDLLGIIAIHIYSFRVRGYHPVSP